ncbi:MAG TPA: carboxypeptidase-like regulatory domain-containing protein [Pyrinomonadaceae bacterium]
MRHRPHFARLLSLGFAFVTFVFALSTAAQSISQPVASLSSVLNADGSIDLGVSGSFDPRGYRLGFGENGAPRFVNDSSPAGGCTPDSWDTNFTINGANGTIHAIVSDGAGNVYVGGDFLGLNNVRTQGIAKWDGTSWSALGSGIGGRVQGIAISGTDVYVGGSFTTAGGVTANNVAKWNGSSWSALGAGMGIPAVQGVLSIAVSGTDVYVGGDFNLSGGFPSFIARWDGVSWSGVGVGMNGSVRTIAVFGGEVYAGGFFSMAGGAPAAGFAKWDGVSWSPVASGAGSSINEIRVVGTDLYAGGNNGVAKWNGSTWSNIGPSFTARALAVSGTEIYAGGSFTTISGTTVNRVARWSGTQWSAMGTGIGGVLATTQVNAVGISGSTVFVGGEFQTAGSLPARNIAKWTAESWSAFDGTGVDNNVTALAVSGTDVYVGGNFSIAGTVTGNRIAKWNGSTWSTLGTGIPGAVINAIAVSGNNVYVGGFFSNAGGQNANNIARWNGSSWSQLGSGVSGPVFVITIAGEDIYVGGSFSSAGGVAANNIAKWNGTAWSGMNSGIVSAVTAIVPSGSDLYVGASTTTVDSPNYFLKYDGTTWTPLGTGMIGGGVSSIAILGTDIFVAGGFTAVGGISANRIAKWNGTSWSALGGGLPTSTGFGSNQVKIALSGSDLIAVGDFSIAGGGPGDRVARWNGSAWVPLGSGLNAAASAISVGGGEVYVGGTFTTAGCNYSPFFARWRETVWTGMTNTDWHTGPNWGSGSVPLPNSGVTIASSNASITAADVIVGNLIVTGGRALTVAAGRTLTVTGNLEIANGSLINQGTLVINGDLILNGGDITTVNQISVGRNLYLNGGKISGGGRVSVLSCLRTAIAGGGVTSFVESPLDRCVNSSGVFRFPVGTGTTYAPIELANISGTGLFLVEPKSGAYSDPVTGLSNNRLLRWWNLTNGGIAQADVTFNYGNADIVGQEHRYRAFRISGGSATQMPTVLNQALNRVTVNGVTSFSPWTLAEGQPTPLTLFGRVTTPNGRGARGVLVTLTDGAGNVRYAITNPFGYYRFTDVLTFNVYTVQVMSKEFRFTTPQRSVDFDEFTTSVNFVASHN